MYCMGYQLQHPMWHRGDNRPVLYIIKSALPAMYLRLIWCLHAPSWTKVTIKNETAELSACILRLIR